MGSSLSMQQDQPKELYWKFASKLTKTSLNNLWLEQAREYCLSIQAGDNRVDHLLGCAVTTKVLCPNLSFWDNTLDCSLKPISKGRKLQMPKHHCRREKQGHWVCLLLIENFLIPNVSCWSSLLKNCMIGPHIACNNSCCAYPFSQTLDEQATRWNSKNKNSFIVTELGKWLKLCLYNNWNYERNWFTR